MSLSIHHVHHSRIDDSTVGPSGAFLSSDKPDMTDLLRNSSMNVKLNFH